MFVYQCVLNFVFHCVLIECVSPLLPLLTSIWGRFGFGCVLFEFRRVLIVFCYVLVVSCSVFVVYRCVLLRFGFAEWVDLGICV